MSKLALVFCLLVALTASFIVGNIESNLKECCTSCSLPTLKYFTIKNTKCGQACINPKDFSKISVFEPGLKLADSQTPCPDNQYTIYNNTETHGVLSLKATLDMYLWGGN